MSPQRSEGHCKGLDNEGSSKGGGGFEKTTASDVVVMVDVSRIPPALESSNFLRWMSAGLFLGDVLARHSRECTGRWLIDRRKHATTTVNQATIIASLLLLVVKLESRADEC